MLFGFGISEVGRIGFAAGVVGPLSKLCWINPIAIEKLFVKTNGHGSQPILGAQLVSAHGDIYLCLDERYVRR